MNINDKFILKDLEERLSELELNRKIEYGFDEYDTVNYMVLNLQGDLEYYNSKNICCIEAYIEGVIAGKYGL